MSSRTIDLTNQRFGRLIVLKEIGSVLSGGERNRRYLCLCDCGRTKKVLQRNLRTGATRSCGCIQKEFLLGRQVKHGHAMGETKKMYNLWRGMINRCHNPKALRYKYYGARGITVCDRWQGENGFENFLADMGEKPEGMTLDRRDVNGNYEPSNCRWATHSEQARNKRSRPDE